MTKILKCPECGSTKNIYARADVRWSAGREVWEIMEFSDVHGDYDCTDCGHCAAPADFEHEGQAA